MGPIQSSINQILGTAAIGAGFFAQSPVGKRMAELRQLNLQQSQLKSQVQALAQKAEDGHLESQGFSESESKFLDEAIVRGREISKRKFELNPTAENFKKYEGFASFKTPQEIAAQRAQQSMEAEQDRIKAQKEMMVGGYNGRNK